MGKSNDVDKSEQGLQALLLALDHESGLEPICPFERSSSSLLVNNVTLLHYAVEFLAANQVKELVVVTQFKELQDLIPKGWFDKISVIVDSNIVNEGDALREVDRRNIIVSDPFVLLKGNVVTNVDIGPALQQHAARKKKDSSNIMTLLFKQVGPTNVVSNQRVEYSSLQPLESDLIVGWDEEQENRVLLYDNQSSQSTVGVPCSFFSSHSKVEVHTDMAHVPIYICSPDVLARFSDAFDYASLEKDFCVFSVQEEEEGLQNRLYAYLLKRDEYASQVTDFSSMTTVSRHLLQRWCYPMVPDNLPHGFSLSRHYLYKDGSTKMGRTSQMSGPGMVGKDCIIGYNCKIESSVIGNNVRIASNVVLKNCHIWDNCVIEEAVLAESSLVGSDCILRQRSVVQSGCVLGKGTVVGKDIRLPRYSRITTVSPKTIQYWLGDDQFDDNEFSSDSSSSEENSSDESDDDGMQEKQDVIQDKLIVSDHHVVGPDGVGRVWLPIMASDPEDSDDESAMHSKEATPQELLQGKGLGSNGVAALYLKRFQFQQEPEDDGLSDGEELPQQVEFGDYENDFAYHEAPTSFASVFTPLVDVVQEFKVMCLEHDESTPIENLRIELNSYKFSQNATYSHVTRAAMLALVEKMDIQEGTTSQKLVSSLKSLLTHWGALFRKLSISTSEEVSIIAALESKSLSDGVVGRKLSTPPSFRLLLQTLHDHEIVSDESVLQWASQRKSLDPSDPKAQLFLQQPTQDLIEYLEQSSDEEDSSDDDEEDSD